MIHGICPICGSKLSEIKPNAEDRHVEHKVYVCDSDLDHKFWVSEYESDCLRWNPASNFEDTLYFRKFKNTQREVVRELALKEIAEIANAEAIRFSTSEASSLVPTELATTKIEKEYNDTPEYLEIFDTKVHQNLLSIIQSLNSTISGLVQEYKKLEKYTDDLQVKYDDVLKTTNTTPSGIILRA